MDGGGLCIYVIDGDQVAKLVEIDHISETSQKTVNDEPKREPKNIVIHHTATSNVWTRPHQQLGKKVGDTYTAVDMFASMHRTWITNRGGSVIPTHYIIDKDGGIKKVNEWGYAVGACAFDKYNTNEQVTECNYNGIHIELVGNFDKHNPTQEQYDTLNQLIIWIQEKAQDEWGVDELGIKGHREYQSKTCPGERFDFDRITQGKPLAIVSGESQPAESNHNKVNVGDVIFFDEITGYYNCLPDQPRYFKDRTYEQEKKINGCGAFKMGWYGLPDHAKTHGACGRGRPFGTILEIEGFGQITCVDRGSAIDNNDIDIRYGIGYEALLDLEKYERPHAANVKVIYLPE